MSASESSLIKESLILNSLIVNSDYRTRVLPYLFQEYFQNQYNRILFSVLKDYLEKYHFAPSKEALIISLKPFVAHFNEENFKSLSDIIDNELYDTSAIHNDQWLLDTTEEFCQNQSIYNAISKSIEIYQGTEKTITKEAIPDLLKESLNISFDTKVGKDYSEDILEQFKFYSKKEYGVPFDIPILNKITNDVGLPRKALTVLLASPGSGKTLSKCHFAAAAMKQGFNVLYFSMEISQERIFQRIDANLLDMEMNDIPNLTEEDYLQKMGKIKKFCKGKLITKEFPTGLATSGHFRHILEELKRKKNIKIDLMIVDYLNICSSARYKTTNGVNSYTLLKSVSEEVRGLAMEYDLAVISSAQINRNNMDKMDMGLEGISESVAISHTADLILYMYRNDQLDQMNRILVTQLKNRFDDLTKNKRFLIGVNRSRMQLFSVGFDETASFLGSASGKDDGYETPVVNGDHFKGRDTSIVRDFSGFKF